MANTFNAQKGIKSMSVSKYAYSPRKCNGQPCPGDCDLGCPLANEPSLEDDVEELMEKDWFHGTPQQKQKIRDISEDILFSMDDVIMAMWICSDTSYETIANEFEERGW